MVVEQLVFLRRKGTTEEGKGAEIISIKYFLSHMGVFSLIFVAWWILQSFCELSSGEAYKCFKVPGGRHQLSLSELV